MGGRMASLAAAEGRLEKVAGLLFVGFPLHAPGRDGLERAAHLPNIKVPMLFLQGTRDKLANIEMMRGLVKTLNTAFRHKKTGL